MKATTLSKRLTSSINIVHFLFASVLIFICNISFAQNTLSQTTGQISDRQYNLNRCDGLNRNENQARTDLIKACTKAGLGMVEQTCSDRLDVCSKKDSKKYSYCLNNATSTDELKMAEEKVDRIRDRMNNLQIDYEELTQKSLGIARGKLEAHSKLEKTLAEISSARTSALQVEINKMEVITNNIAQKYDELDLLQLGLRKFVLENEMKCRESAEKIRSEYITTVSINKQKRYLTHAQLISRTGLSINDAGTLKYNRYLRNCTALYTKNGDRTGFGSQYSFEQRIIKSKRSIIKRELTRFKQQRAKVKAEKIKTLGSLNVLQAQAVSEYLRALKNIENESLAASSKGSFIQSNILSTQIELEAAKRKAGVESNRAIIHTASNLRDSSAPSITVASKSKIDAFNEANALRIQLKDAKRNNSGCNSIIQQFKSVSSSINKN